MRSHARVAIIGGGVVGCLVAYHITRLGWREVMVIERNELTSGSTWHAAGQCPHYAETLFLARTYKDAFQLYKGLEAETGVPVGVHATGGLRLARDKDTLDDFKRFLGLARIVGMDAEIVGPNRMRELWPLLETDGFVAGLHTKDEGWVDPSQTTNALAKAARDRGAEINRHTRVVGLARTPSGDWRIETDKGVVMAEIVVNAAGCWGAEISAMLGHYLPVLAKEHQYFVTEPAPMLKGLSAELPVLRDYSVPLYARQEGAGLMISGYEHQVKFRWLDGAPKDFANELFPPDLERAEPCLEETYRMIPALQKLGIRTIVNGPIPGTPDLMGLVGPAHGLPGYFACCGIYGGIGQGGVTRQLAEWIVEGEPSIDMAPVDPRRFGDFAGKDYLVSRLVAGHLWSGTANYPETESSGGRPARKSPLHDALAAKRAAFGVIQGWEVPNWFAPAGVEPADKPVFGRANWFPHVGAECRAVRDGAGLFDLSWTAAFDVSGPGAQPLLERLLAHDLPAIGRRAMGAFLAPMGGVRFHLTVDRLAADRFVLRAHGADEHALGDWLRQHAREDNTEIANRTEREGGLLLAGARAGAILDAASGTTLSAMTAGDARDATIGGAAVRVARVDDVHANAWHLHADAARMPALYDALWRHGASQGLKDIGRRAWDSLRLEHHHPRCGVDFGIETALGATGLPPARAGNGFIGADAIKDGAPRRSSNVLVRLHVTVPCPVEPWGGEVVEVAGRMIGRVTSGAYGHLSERTLAFAQVDAAAARSGAAFDIVLFGERYAARAG